MRSLTPRELLSVFLLSVVFLLAFGLIWAYVAAAVFAVATSLGRSPS